MAFRSNRRVLNTITGTTVIVYNQFSMDAQLAAAVIYSELQAQEHRRSVVIFNNTQIVPSDADRYIWVGLEPMLSGKARDRFGKGSEHTILGRHERELGWKDRLRQTIGRDRLAEVGMESANLTLLEHAVSVYGAYSGMDWTRSLDINLPNPAHNTVRLGQLEATSPVSRISNLIRQFYDPQLSEHELVLLYVNWRAAMNTIETGAPFYWREVSTSDLAAQTQAREEWLGFVRGVKRRITGNVEFSSILDKSSKRVEPYVWTAWAAEDYSWAMRLISHSQRRILNVVEGISGRIVTSPFSRVENLKLQGHFRPADVY